MKIYALGRAFVDYFYNGIINFSTKNTGPHISDFEFESLLSKLKLDNSKKIIMESGGSSCNTAKSLAFLGHQVTFIGTIGAENPVSNIYNDFKPDIPGCFFYNSLKNYGIKTILSCYPGKTARCLIARQQKGVSVIAANPGVSSKISFSNIDINSLNNSDWIIIEGMELNNIEMNMIFSEIYNKANTAIALCCGTTFGAKNLAEFIKRNYRQIIKEKNTNSPAIIFANQEEASVLEATKINFFEYSKEQGIIFIFTQGKDGCIAYYNGNKIFQKSIDISLTNPDPTGAGDVFAGFFLHYFENLKTNENYPFNISDKLIQKGLAIAAKGASKILEVPLCNLNHLKSFPFDF